MAKIKKMIDYIVERNDMPEDMEWGEAYGVTCVVYVRVMDKELLIPPCVLWKRDWFGLGIYAVAHFYSYILGQEDKLQPMTDSQHSIDLPVLGGVYCTQTHYVKWMDDPDTLASTCSAAIRASVAELKDELAILIPETTYTPAEWQMMTASTIDDMENKVKAAIQTASTHVTESEAPEDMNWGDEIPFDDTSVWTVNEISIVYLFNSVGVHEVALLAVLTDGHKTEHFMQPYRQVSVQGWTEHHWDVCDDLVLECAARLKEEIISCRTVDWHGWRSMLDMERGKFKRDFYNMARRYNPTEPPESLNEENDTPEDIEWGDESLILPLWEIYEVEIFRDTDLEPDLSYLGTFGDRWQQGCIDCTEQGDRLVGRRYFYPTNEAVGEEQYRRYVAFCNDEWDMIGIRAEVTLKRMDTTCRTMPGHELSKDVSSIGIWNVESDSNNEYLVAIADEELSDIKEQLEDDPSVDMANWDEAVKKAWIQFDRGRI